MYILSAVNGATFTVGFAWRLLNVGDEMCHIYTYENRNGLLYICLVRRTAEHRHNNRIM